MVRFISKTNFRFIFCNQKYLFIGICWMDILNKYKQKSGHTGNLLCSFPFIITGLFSRNSCILYSFIFSEDMSEDKTNDWSGIDELPEKCRREIHSCRLNPYSDELTSCILKQDCGSKAHQWAHKCHRWYRNSKNLTEWMTISKSTIRAAHINASLDTMKKSRMKAIGPMMISSWNAERNTSFRHSADVQ